MPDYPNARDCKHGSLARACEVCGLEEEVRDLRSALAAAEERLGWANAVIECVEEMVSESRGLDGWHLNGDVAEWDELDGLQAALAAWREGEKTNG